MRPPIGEDKDGDAAKRANRKRSIAIAVALALMVSMFYAATIVHLGGAGVMNRGPQQGNQVEVPAAPKP